MHRYKLKFICIISLPSYGFRHLGKRSEFESFGVQTTQIHLVLKIPECTEALRILSTIPTVVSPATFPLCICYTPVKEL